MGQRITKPAQGAIRRAVGAIAGMVDDAIVDTEPAGHHGRATGKAGGVRTVELVKTNTFPGDLVNVGTRIAMISGTSQMVGS